MLIKGSRFMQMERVVKALSHNLLNDEYARKLSKRKCVN